MSNLTRFFSRRLFSMEQVMEQHNVTTTTTVYFQHIYKVTAYCHYQNILHKRMPGTTDNCITALVIQLTFFFSTSGNLINWTQAKHMTNTFTSAIAQNS